MTDDVDRVLKWIKRDPILAQRVVSRMSLPYGTPNHIDFVQDILEDPKYMADMKQEIASAVLSARDEMP